MNISRRKPPRIQASKTYEIKGFFKPKDGEDYPKYLWFTYQTKTALAAMRQFRKEHPEAEVILCSSTSTKS